LLIGIFAVTSLSALPNVVSIGTVAMGRSKDFRRKVKGYSQTAPN